MSLPGEGQDSGPPIKAAYKSNAGLESWPCPLETALSALFVLLIWLASLIYCLSADVTLAWDPSPDAGIASYRVHYGTLSGTYTATTNAGLATNLTVSGLNVGKTYWFAATAVGTNDLESHFSNEVGYTVPIPPPLVHAQSAVLLTPRGMTSSNLLDWVPCEFTPTWLNATSPAAWFSVTGATIHAADMLSP
ncbi:MAG: fibronectin type III domain-containing protein [Verrucomicrobia bacterium]|jgi:hypothetical protein|nr:fibronectin type III domain-containing protein [Verrucomicrobiota bacterium]